MTTSPIPRVVIIGGGFGGLCAARALKRAPVEVVLIDRRNHHLFQPLLYQVATGGLSPANIAAPLRALVGDQANTRVLLAEVEDLDLASRTVVLAGDGTLDYDELIVATGASTHYFGNDAWAARAPGLKSLDDATNIRRRVLLSFERAERTEDPERRRSLLTFVVVGGGPTGVELAGAIAEVAKRTLANEFRSLDTRSARVILVEGRDRLLGAFTPPLSTAAEHGLAKLGVEVMTGAFVRAIDDDGVRVAGKDGGETVFETRSVFWAAGVKPSPLGARIAEQSEAELDRGGRVKVMPDCSVSGHPEVSVIGDLANFAGPDGEPLPGLAPVAMQQGRYVARRLVRRLRGRPVPAFRYFDKGNMATIGRKMAVAEIGRFRTAGMTAWLAWLFIHLMYLAEFQNRVLVLIQWGWNYFTRNRSARLITGRIEDDDGSLDRPG